MKAVVVAVAVLLSSFAMAAAVDVVPAAVVATGVAALEAVHSLTSTDSSVVTHCCLYWFLVT